MKPGDITFRFKQFAVTDCRCGMKVSTDSVLAGALAGGADAVPARVADIGAGCGVIALMLAQRFADARIDAVEIEPGAAADLRQNIGSSPWASRISPIEGDFSELSGPYDLIVSNPPYFTNGDVAPDSARALARHAGKLSPFSLLAFASRNLAPDGILSMIVPSELAEDIIAEAPFEKIDLVRRIDIATSPRRGVTRAFLEFARAEVIDSGRKKISPPARLDTNGDDYRRITRDFYLNF